MPVLAAANLRADHGIGHLLANALVEPLQPNDDDEGNRQDDDPQPGLHAGTEKIPQRELGRGHTAASRTGTLGTIRSSMTTPSRRTIFRRRQRMTFSSCVAKTKVVCSS